MKTSEHFIPDRRILLVNVLVCVIICLPFGLLSRNIVAWVAAGVTSGLAAGLAAEFIFHRWGRRDRLYRIRLVCLVWLEALLAIFVLTPGFGAYRVVHPTRYPVVLTPADVELEYEDIELTTTDGVKIAGWYLPSRNGAAVIAVHALQGNRTNVLYHAKALQKHGYGVLLFDLRAHGESGGNRFAAGWNSDLDVEAAYRYLQSCQDVDPTRIGALGLSVGANVVIYAATHQDDIRALWVDGTGVGRLEDLLEPLPPEYRALFFMSPVYWMYDRWIEVFSGVRARPPIRSEVTRIAPRPIQFVSSGDGWEQFQTRKYHAAAASGWPVWEMSDVTHTGGMTVHSTEYGDRMAAFFDTCLLADAISE